MNIELNAITYQPNYRDTTEQIRIIQAYKAGAMEMQKEYEEKLRWIPVTEDLPDKDNYTQCLWKNEKGEIWFGMARESQKPTHWKHCFL